MSKLTYWEREMMKAGYQIIPFTHEEIVEHLLDVFKMDREHLLVMAAADNTKRRELVFVLDYANIGDIRTIFGGTIVYSKKKRRFTHINYSDNHNWLVQFSIESKASYFSYEFWKPLQKIQRFWSIKKLRDYLLNN